MVEKLPKVNQVFSSASVDQYYKNRNVHKNSFELHTVDIQVVSKHLKQLNENKAVGLDGIPAKFLKESSESISEQVTFIMNLSISTNSVPKDFKCAKVVPIYKKNDKFEVGNYRPVSVLCCLSKILESIVYEQLEKYLINNSILYEHQSGFRSGFSTGSCLIHLTDHIKSQINLGNYTGMILLDLQKAFDTVDHKILFSKLTSIGLSPNSVKWFTSYLNQRTQIVSINNNFSNPMNITCGVPQGSILGPLLFLIYVNDMKAAVNCKLLLYADDSALIVSNKNVDIIEKSLSEELNCVRQWLIDNKLSLHLGKTESILFASNRKLKIAPSLKISCDGHIIESSDSVKYLGAHLEQTLNGQAMATNILKKANSRLKFLYRQAYNLDMDSRKTLSSALILSHFDYACTSWYSSLTADLKKKLQTCQNKIARFVLKVEPMHHIGPLEFHSLNWLNVEHRVKQLKLNIVHSIFYNLCPSYLSEFFFKISHQYNTRSSSHNFIPPKSTTVIEKTFFHSGIGHWNALPNHIKNLQSKAVFKAKMKNHLKDRMISTRKK